MLSQQERRSSSTSSLGVSRVPQASYAQSDESKLREKMYKKSPQERRGSRDLHQIHFPHQSVVNQQKKDLKATGKTKLNTQGFISAIIEKSISKNYDNSSADNKSPVKRDSPHISDEMRNSPNMQRHKNLPTISPDPGSYANTSNKYREMEHASKQEMKQGQDHHQPKQLDGIIRMALMHDPLNPGLLIPPNQALSAEKRMNEEILRQHQMHIRQQTPPSTSISPMHHIHAGMTSQQPMNLTSQQPINMTTRRQSLNNSPTSPHTRHKPPSNYGSNASISSGQQPNSPYKLYSALRFHVPNSEQQNSISSDSTSSQQGIANSATRANNLTPVSGRVLHPSSSPVPPSGYNQRRPQLSMTNNQKLDYEPISDDDE